MLLSANTKPAPLSEFLDFNEFAWPDNVGERLQSNFHYYSGNYLVVYLVYLLVLW